MGNQVVQKQKYQNKKKQIFDDRFGGKVILQYQNPQIYASKTLRLTSKQQLNSTIEIITKRSKLIHKNFCTVKNYHIYDKQDFCSEIIGLDLVYQYYQNDLYKQILNRSTKNDHFSQQIICKTIYQICDCLYFLQQRKCYHGDIKSSTVFLDRKNDVRLQDSYFTHHGKTNLEFMISKSNFVTYLSPSQLQLLRNGGYSDSKNQTYKNQIFSVGMTILEALLLSSSQDCYDMIGKRILETKIKAKIKKARQIYSQNLINLLSGLLEIDSQKRLNYSQILNSPIIKGFGSKISLLAQNLKQKSITRRNSGIVSGNQLK